jgi:hypothetical protein
LISAATGLKTTHIDRASDDPYFGHDNNHAPRSSQQTIGKEKDRPRKAYLQSHRQTDRSA